MLVNFFTSKDLSSEFDLTFVYRFSEEYESGAKKRMNLNHAIPVKLVTRPKESSFVVSNNRILAYIEKIVWYLCVFIIKYLSIWINYRRLLPIFRNQHPDILHINNGGYPAATSCYAAILAARKCGINKIIYIVNNMASDYGIPLRWFDRLIDQIVKKQVSFFITGSDNAGDRLKGVLKIPGSQHITIRNGIIPREVTMTKQEFRKLYNIGQDTFVFAEVANLEERKGHIVLLKAIKEILEYHNMLNFVILIEGKGPLKGFISSYIDKNNLSKFVRLIEVEQIYNLYNSIDVLILPSIHSEDFPNTIIEAMGMGIPVIGSSIAGIPEQIDDHKSGILIPPGDVTALRKAMESFYANKVFYERCAAEAKRKFDSNYSASISVNNYLNLYRSLLR